MAVVTLNKKELKKIINLDDRALDDKLNMLGLGVERISENEVDVEVTPNRPDMLSQSGIFRALSCWLGKKVKPVVINKPEKEYQVKIDSSVKQVRPFTACAIVKNLKFTDEKIKEVIDIQEKLHSTIGRNRKKIAIGIYPLEKIKLPIRFMAKKPEDIKFIPLEASEELNGRQILSKLTTGRDYAHLLEGKDKFPIFIDANNEILSMPPIINSHKTGKIDEKTKDIFIECSGFDFQILKKTLNILVTMFSDMSGEVYQMKLDYGKQEITPNLEPEKMKINIEHVNKLLGLKLGESEIKKLLEKMGYEYKNKQVEIPCYRTDILHEVDLIEDIAIAYGYENFNPEIPKISTIGEESKLEILKREICEILAGLEMLELSTLHLLTKEDLVKAGIKQAIEVEKSKSDFKFLRPSLLISALKVLSENTDADYPQKIFEIDKIFSLNDKEETGIEEKNKLVICLAPGNFTEIKQAAEYLLRMLNLEYKIEEAKNENYIEGRTACLVVNGKRLGVFGEIHPQVLKNWRIKMPLACLELDVDELI